MAHISNFNAPSRLLAPTRVFTIELEKSFNLTGGYLQSANRKQTYPRAESKDLELGVRQITFDTSNHLAISRSKISICDVPNRARCKILQDYARSARNEQRVMRSASTDSPPPPPLTTSDKQQYSIARWINGSDAKALTGIYLTYSQLLRGLNP